MVNPTIFSVCMYVCVLWQYLALSTVSYFLKCPLPLDPTIANFLDISPILLLSSLLSGGSLLCPISIIRLLLRFLR